MNRNKRAKEIAKNTKLGIIESEIEDWKNGIKSLNIEIKRFQLERNSNIQKLHLWELARKYKIKNVE